MATTTNFGWTTPNDTDLVKDGAAAIRTLGSSIDTTLVDLKGGTTGQLLTKASGTDMDFTWAAPAASGGLTLIATTTLTGASVTVSSIPQTYKHLYIVFDLVRTASGGQIAIQINSDTGAEYWYSSVRNRLTTVAGQSAQAGTMFLASWETSTSANANTYAGGDMTLFNYTDTTGRQYINAQTWSFQGEPANYVSSGHYERAAATTEITYLTNNGNYTSGTAYLYGVN
jgi:hypothetical protein